MYLEDVFLKPSFQQSVSTKGLSDEEIGNLLTVGVLNTEVTLSREAAKAETSGKLGIRQYIDGLPIVQSSQVSESFSTIVKDVKLWDIVSPHLYDVTTQLLFDNQVVD